MDIVTVTVIDGIVDSVEIPESLKGLKVKVIDIDEHAEVPRIEKVWE